MDPLTIPPAPAPAPQGDPKDTKPGVAVQPPSSQQPQQTQQTPQADPNDSLLNAAATEFAFLVGIPTMFAATGYELIDVLKSGQAADENWSAFLVAFVASAVTAFIAVKWLLRYIQSHRFTAFAVYRLLFGATLLLLVPSGG